MGLVFDVRRKQQLPLPKREEARIVIQRGCLNSICFQVVVIVNFFCESERARIREGDHELKGASKPKVMWLKRQHNFGAKGTCSHGHANYGHALSFQIQYCQNLFSFLLQPLLVFLFQHPTQYSSLMIGLCSFQGIHHFHTRCGPFLLATPT